MPEITINVSDAERNACLAAITELNNIAHLKYMSIAMIAETAGIKETKCRAVLDDLIASKTITKYQATDNKRIQRYYYVINGAKQ